ncbi:MAG TPA: hypothetical protein VFR87_13330 [Nocardioidaceae bacterium]|nr:hypothetical protein [Nocardioidaceae bacterium]
MTHLSRTRGLGWAALLLLLPVGCSSTDTGQVSGEDPASPAENPFGHVHGLGVNPADDRLYVASHMGVFEQTDGGFERIADRWQDTMAFTVAGPDHFLASGHPDLREDKPPHLGLVESTDAAETWESLSLEGEADFHVLELAGDRLYGYNSVTQTLMVTDDRRTWSEVLTAPLLDAEADPSDPQRLVLSDPRGELMTLEAGGRPEAVPDGPSVGLLDWPAEDVLVGLGPQGEVWVSRDGGARWEPAGMVPGSPQALAATADGWYVATDRGLFSSTDQGATWETVEGG